MIFLGGAILFVCVVGMVGNLNHLPDDVAIVSLIDREDPVVLELDVIYVMCCQLTCMIKMYIRLVCLDYGLS
jgi:hypothetical protein